MFNFVYDRFDSFLLKLGCNMYLTSKNLLDQYDIALAARFEPSQSSWYFLYFGCASAQFTIDPAVGFCAMWRNKSYVT